MSANDVRHIEVRESLVELEPPRIRRDHELRARAARVVRDVVGRSRERVVDPERDAAGHLPLHLNLQRVVRGAGTAAADARDRELRAWPEEGIRKSGGCETNALDPAIE